MWLSLLTILDSRRGNHRRWQRTVVATIQVTEATLINMLRQIWDSSFSAMIHSASIHLTLHPFRSGNFEIYRNKRLKLHSYVWKALIQGEVIYVSNSFTTAAPCDAVKAGNSWVLDDLVISSRLLLFQQIFFFFSWRLYSKFKFLDPGAGEVF